MQKTVHSEVTGTVWRVDYELGNQVEAGDIVMVLESMKMEIPVEAPISGTLITPLVEKDDSVEEGTVLFVIES